MMSAAERDREFVAHLSAERAGLRETEMMVIRGLPPADETGLRGHKFEMGFIAVTARFTNREHALVDSSTNGFTVSADIAPDFLRLDAIARR